MSRILLIEDDAIVRESLSEVLTIEGYDVVERDRAEGVPELLEHEVFDVIITDLKLPGMSGMELVKLLSGGGLDSEIVIITGYGSMESAIQALKLGVFDFVNKPFDPPSIVNTIHNAAEKVELRRQKAENEELIRTLKEFNEDVLESSPEAIIAMDRSFVCRAWNSAAEELSGIPREKVIGRNIVTEGVWLLGKRMPREFQEALNGNVQENIVTAVSPKKQKYVLRQKVSPLRDSEGKVRGILVFLVNVTQEQTADKKKEKLKTGKDLDLRRLSCMYDIRTASERAESLDGFLVEARDCISRALPVQNGSKVEIEFETGAGKHGGPDEPGKGFSAEINGGIIGSGRLRISGGGSSLMDEDKSLVAGAAEVIGEAIARKGAEDLAAHVRHLKSLGRLAGGLAHNLNNILGGILGYTSFVKSEIPGDSPLQEYLNTIEESSSLAAEITGQLLDLSTAPPSSRGIIDMNEKVRRVVSLMRIFLDRNVIISSKLDSELMSVEGESAQLDRVLINMCLNARESIHAGGKVTISTENAEIGKDTEANRLGLRPGRYVRIDLKDTGIGMSEEAVRNCFDPFFSTKGLGYGLGLSSAHGIVSAHGGQIIVNSRPGKGTVMSVYLPGILKTEAGGGKSARKETHRTILVADDEELIRKMVSDGLGSMGYRVLMVRDGDEAVRVLKKEGEEIDIALIDIIMPGKGYSELCEEIKECCGEVKVILSSGYKLTQDAIRYIDEEGVHFIQKPYRLQDLTSVIEKALGTEKKTKAKAAKPQKKTNRRKK